MALHGCNLHGIGGILHGHERTCKICSIFMPRLDIDPSQVLSRSHGKSWQNLDNFFLREGGGNMVTRGGKKGARLGRGLDWGRKGWDWKEWV